MNTSTTYSNFGSTAKPRPTADAWCVFELDGAKPPCLIDSYGVSGVTRAGPITGVVRVNFTDPKKFASGNYVCLVTPEKTVSLGFIPNIAAYSHGQTAATGYYSQAYLGGVSAYCDITTTNFNPVSMVAPSALTDFANGTNKFRINAAFFSLRSDNDTGKTGVFNYAPTLENWGVLPPTGASGGTVVVPNAADAPDGTRTAYGIRVTPNSLGTRKYVQFSIPSAFKAREKPWNMSIFVKAGEPGRVLQGASANIALFNNGIPTAGGMGGSPAVRLNLNTGVFSVSTTNRYVSHEVENYGDGWYRVSLSTLSNNPNASGYDGEWNGYFSLNSNPSGNVAGNETNWSGNGAIEFYVWGAQVEEGSVTTPHGYTYANSAGTNPATSNQDVLVNHSPGLCGFGSPTLQNLLLYSENFANAAWIKNRVGVRGGYTAPDGTATAYRLEELAPTDTGGAGTGSPPQYYKSLSVGPTFYPSAGSTTGTGTYTFSVHAKAAERRYFAFADQGRGQFGSLIVDLLTGQVVNNTYGKTVRVVNAGSGWWRIITTLNSDIAFVNSAHRFAFAGTTDSSVSGYDSIYGPSYPGVCGQGILVWGAQLEQGTVYGEYTPTSGTAVGTTFARVASGVTHQSHILGLKSAGEATAWGTVVIPPAIGSSSPAGAYLEHYHGVSGACFSNATSGELTVSFSELMSTDSYCVVLGREQEPVYSPEGVVSDPTSIPPRDEFCLSHLGSVTSSKQRSRNQFKILTARNTKYVNIIKNSFAESSTLANTWATSPYEFTNSHVVIANETAIAQARRNEMAALSPNWIKCVKNNAANGRAILVPQTVAAGLSAAFETGWHYRTTAYLYSATGSGISALSWNNEGAAPTVFVERVPGSGYGALNDVIQKIVLVWRMDSGVLPTLVLRSGNTDPVNSTFYITGLKTDKLTGMYPDYDKYYSYGREQRINFMVFGGKGRYGTG